MPSQRHQRFTIYDAMERKGLFESNPANADSRDGENMPLYRGPVEYPKMFYHPEGTERVTVPSEIIATPLGPKEVGRQTELIWELAHGPEDEKRLRAAGWHDHPARAMAAAGKEAPAMSSAQRISDLEAEIRRLQAERDAAGALALSEQRTSGQSLKGRLGGRAE